MLLLTTNAQQVETCQEKIFSLELEDPKSLESPMTPTTTPIEQFMSSLQSSNDIEQQQQQQNSADESDDNHSMVTVCPNNTDDTLILHPTDPSDYINANVNTRMSSDDDIDYANQINTIVQVVNPLLVGDGVATEIAIGHAENFSSFDMSDNDGVTYRRNVELSLNDKMKNVLKELKQNEKVRLSLSRSMEEEEEDEEDDDFEMTEKQCEEEVAAAAAVVDENVVSTSYEEKTGSIGTVFMVRERLINDFYDHEQHDNIDDNQASIDSCQVYSNPSVDEFLAHEIRHTQDTLSARKEALTLDLTTTELDTNAESNNNVDDEDENNDDDTSTADNTPSTPNKPFVQDDNANVAGNGTNNASKKKRRKGKNKSKK